MTARVIQGDVFARIHVVGMHRMRKGSLLEVTRAVQRERSAIDVRRLHAARVERHVAALGADEIHRIPALNRLVHELRSLPQP